MSIPDKYQFGLEIEADFPETLSSSTEASGLWHYLRSELEGHVKVENIKKDGSLYMDGIEITSPILSFVEIKPWVSEVVERIKSKTRITYRCGGHIHVSPKMGSVLNRNTGFAVESLINEIRTFEFLGLPDSVFRYDYHILYNSSYNSLEFRPWKGTFDPEQWENNAYYSAKLLDYTFNKLGYVV